MACTALVANAQGMSTQADAFNAGKAFAQPGSNAAAGTVNTRTGAENLPSFTTTAPQSASYGNGKGNVGAAGSAKQTACQTSTSTDPMAQQECDAVNFLSKNPSVRPKFSIDKKSDPLMVGSKEVIKNPGTNPGSSNQQCRVVNVNKPGTFASKTCTEAYVAQDVACQKVATPTVTWQTQCSAWLTSSSINGMTSGGSVSCGQAEPGLIVDIGTIASQCHGGGCNSDYYPFAMGINIGTPSYQCAFLAVNYKGTAWQHVCGSYDGHQTISFSGDYTELWGYAGAALLGVCNAPLTLHTQNQGHGSSYSYYTCDAGYSLPSVTFSGGWTKTPQISYAWNNLCESLEASAK